MQDAKARNAVTKKELKRLLRARELELIAMRAEAKKAINTSLTVQETEDAKKHYALLDARIMELRTFAYLHLNIKM